MRIIISTFIFFSIIALSYGQILDDSEMLKLRDQLTVNFKGDAQIEVGGPYAGLEFHHASPLPQRISFYYPAANSIDNSTDYWHRDTTFVLELKIKKNKEKYEDIGKEIWEYNLTPYRVNFTKADAEKIIEITYEFCKDSPAFLFTFTVKNNTDSVVIYNLETNLTTTLRTCHTYKTIFADSFSLFGNNSSYKYSYNDIGTKFAQLFILNKGEKPVNRDGLNFKAELKKAVFNYEKKLQPGESLTVKQIIGSTTSNEFEKVTNYIADNYENEIKKYESEVLSQSFKTNTFITGNKDLDFTNYWAKAVITCNKHYLDGDLLSMPCPAEYNFFFTHDVLVTDLAVVLYDLTKVKNDLLFLEKHKSKENILPHAYYWKDSLYVTEYSQKDNWNHLWFLLLAGNYLRHSGDIQLLNLIYPIICKSMEITLSNKQPDDLMWAARPDGWDIGTSYGPRTFMTVMAIQAFKEFIYISNKLQKNVDKLNYYEDLTRRMNEQLVNKLWSNEQNYLINYYEDGSVDKHYYIGSLLASHFRLIDLDKSNKLVNSAKQNLLDDKLGVYNVFPMDFLSLKDFLKFQGDEVGQPFHYANGGIWQNGNAWYALGLISNGQYDEAYSFIKNIMTMNGVINSPNGQPAMYEYRISDKNNPAIYGKIDKPMFLWAGGWYLYTLYNLFGIEEDDWNISFNPYMPNKTEELKIPITVKGNLVDVNISGKGKFISSISYDGKEMPSAIIPSDLDLNKNINIELGEIRIPYLKLANANVSLVKYDNKSKILSFSLNSFANHKIHLEMISPLEIDQMKINNLLVDNFEVKSENNNYKINYDNIAKNSIDKYEIKFK